MQMDLDKYEEVKECRWKRVIWYFVNLLIFPLLRKVDRNRILRLFGAKVGNICRVYRSVKIYAPWKLEMGDKVCFGPRVEVYNKDWLKIGSNVIVSQDAYICTASHDLSSPVMALKTAPVTINNMCWMAAKSTILPGVTIGEGAVVGACAVVAKDVPPWSVVVGNPARVVGKRELCDEKA